MRKPNGYGSITMMKGARRKPYRVRTTTACIADKKTGAYAQTMKTIGYYATRKEAEIALANYNQNPFSLDASKITFAEVFERWSKDFYPKTSKSNVNGYNAAYKCCGAISEMRFVDIRQPHLQAVIDSCGKNYPTMRKIKQLFLIMYKFARVTEICDHTNRARDVDILQYKDRNPDKIDRKPFTDEEIEILWKWAKKGNEYAGAILILIYTGIRIGELRELEKINVHLEDRYFQIVKSKTPAGIRRVPITKKIVPLMRWWMNQKSDYLLCTKTGHPLKERNFYDAYWNPVLEQIGIDTTHRPHDCRHTCISLLTRAGVDERLIRKIVGHAGKGITENVYTHFDMRQLIEAIDKI